MDDMWRELVEEASNAAHNLCAELESVQFGHRDSGPIREWLKEVIDTLNDRPSLYDVTDEPIESPPNPYKPSDARGLLEGDLTMQEVAANLRPDSPLPTSQGSANTKTSMPRYAVGNTRDGCRIAAESLGVARLVRSDR